MGKANAADGRAFRYAKSQKGLQALCQFRHGRRGHVRSPDVVVPLTCAAWLLAAYAPTSESCIAATTIAAARARMVETFVIVSSIGAAASRR
jgi:hypothetical protein